MMMSKTIMVDHKKYYLPLTVVWKKMNWNNKYTKLNQSDIEWRISKKFTTFMHVCSLCRGLIWIFLSFLCISSGLLVKGNHNIFLIFLNLILIILPILLFELAILLYAPIEIEKDEIKINENTS